MKKNLFFQTLFLFFFPLFLIAQSIDPDSDNRPAPLPDFSKAIAWPDRVIPPGCDIVSNAGLRFTLFDACEVGAFNLEIYVEHKGQLYLFIKTDLLCLEDTDLYKSLPPSEQKIVKTYMPAFGIGTWYYRMTVKCGIVKKFEIRPNGMSYKNWTYKLECQ